MPNCALGLLVPVYMYTYTSASKNYGVVWSIMLQCVAAECFPLQSWLSFLSEVFCISCVLQRIVVCSDIVCSSRSSCALVLSHK